MKWGRGRVLSELDLNQAYEQTNVDDKIPMPLTPYTPIRLMKIHYLAFG